MAPAVGDIEHLPENIRPKSATLKLVSHSHFWETSLAEIKKSVSDETEKQYLQQGLSEVEGKVSDFAKKMAMNRSHLQTLLKKHGIRSKSFRTNPPQDVIDLADLS